MTVEIILYLCAFVIGILITLIALWPQSRRSVQRYEHKNLIKKLKYKHSIINAKINIYEEDLEINRLLVKYPFLKEDFDEYRAIREELTGIGTIAQPGETTEGTKQTDGDRTTSDRGTDNK